MDLIIHSVRALYCFPPAIREPNFSLNIDRSWPDGYDYTIYACTLFMNTLFMLVLLLDKQKYNYLEDLEKKTRTVNDAIIQIVNTDLILRGYITTICSLLDNRTLHQDLRKHVGSFYQHLLVLKNNFRRNSAVSAPCGKPTKCFTEHKRSREVLHVHRIFSVAFEFFYENWISNWGILVPSCPRKLQTPYSNPWRQSNKNLHKITISDVRICRR